MKKPELVRTIFVCDFIWNGSNAKCVSIVSTFASIVTWRCVFCICGRMCANVLFFYTNWRFYSFVIHSLRSSVYSTVLIRYLEQIRTDLFSWNQFFIAEILTWILIQHRLIIFVIVFISLINQSIIIPLLYSFNCVWLPRDYTYVISHKSSATIIEIEASYSMTRKKLKRTYKSKYMFGWNFDTLEFHFHANWRKILSQYCIHLRIQSR